jgi:hypothetical protein
MSDQPLDLSRTWTEAEYLALGEPFSINVHARALIRPST